MMKPTIIMHNSISLDGGFIGFDINMELHYQTATDFHAEAHLVGSTTAKTGIEMFMGHLPKETETDFNKPDRKNLPYYIIPDSKGTLQGLLHIYRQTEYCRDVIVIISHTTPESYIRYLRDRGYDYHVFGERNIDFEKAIPVLSQAYSLKTIMTDTGPTLNSVLLNHRLVDEISLLIHPIIAGKISATFFQLFPTTSLRLISSRTLKENYLSLRYSIV